MTSLNIDKDALFALMSENNQRRCETHAPLLKHAEIPNFNWSYELPTLGKYRANKPLPTGKQCVEALFVDGLDEGIADALLSLLNGGHFIIAGGSICDLLNINHIDVFFDVDGESDDSEGDDSEGEGESLFNDLDIFAVGLSPDEAESRIMDFISSVERARMFRTPNCITVIVANIELQFITRVYESVSQVLYGFDIAAAAVALVIDTHDRGDILFTPLAAFAHKTRSFPLDLERRRSSFETRVSKYYNGKKFNVIFPHLDLESIKDEFKLNKMTIDIKRFIRDKHFIGKLNINSTGYPLEKNEDAVYGTLPYHDVHDIILFNISKIMWNNNYLVTTLAHPVSIGISAGTSEFSTKTWQVVIDGNKSLDDVSSYDFDYLDENEPLLVKIIYSKLNNWSRENKLKLIMSTFNHYHSITELMVAAAKLDVAECEDMQDTPLDREQIKDDYYRILLQISRDIADIVRLRAKNIIPNLMWKASYEGTTNAPLFEMKYVDPATYYGDHYLPEETLTKCALKH